jgi:hypothetical protein
MKTHKLTITSLIFACCFFIGSLAHAKVAPLDLTVGAPQYGNTDVPALVAPAPTVASPNFSSKLSTNSFSIFNPQNGEAYNIFGTWYVYNNGNWNVGYPIDSNIVILLIAGVAIGIKVIVSQNKKNKLQLTV